MRQPAEPWLSAALRTRDDSAKDVVPPAPGPKPTSTEVWLALLPWIIVCVILLVWGTNAFKSAVNPWATWNYPVPELHNMINKVAPVAPKPTPEGAVFSFTWLSYTGSGMLIAVMLGIGRAIGETMVVMMVTGNAANIPPFGPGMFFQPVRTMTATIAAEMGEVAQGTLHYNVLFGVGIVLFVITFAINSLANRLVGFDGGSRARGGKL